MSRLRSKGRNFQEGGIVDFEVDGLLVGSKGFAIVESKTGLAASHITDIVRTGCLVKKYCRQLGLLTAHAQVLDQSNMINILACPAVTKSLLSIIANRDPGICVLADCGGSFELVRDFDGQLRSGPANPAAAALSRMALNLVPARPGPGKVAYHVTRPCRPGPAAIARLG